MIPTITGDFVNATVVILMVKRALRNGVMAVFLLAIAAHASAKVVEQLVAVIDGEPYTLSNFASFAKTRMDRQFPSGDLNQINTSDREVLEEFITNKLLEAEIREAGIKVGDDDVDQYIDQIKQKNKLTEDDLKTALSREGQTLATYRASVKTELEKNEIINRQVRAKVSITNEDVERYYKLNSKKFRSDDRARIRHILLSLPDNASANAVEAAQARAADIYQRIKGGQDFAQLARENSEGAGQAEGGDIGWVKRGTLIPGIEEAAFDKLSVGEVSEPFRTSMGFHIVKLEARELGAPLPLTAVSSRIKDELYQKALDERFAKWLRTDLRRKHRVDVKLPGVVFKAEDSKEGMMDSLVASSTRRGKSNDRSLLSYLNPFSYVVKDTDLDSDDPKSPMYGKKVVSVLGVPLFTKDSADDVPELASDPGDKKSDGFFSSVLGVINPFSKSTP